MRGPGSQKRLVGRSPGRLWAGAMPWVLPAVIIAAVLGAWEGVVGVYDIPHWKLPAPSAVLDELFDSRGLLARHTWVTLKEVLIGFSIALAGGIFIAVLIHMSRTLERAIYPWVIASQTTPIIVIALLLLIWVGYGIQHKVIVVAIISFFPIVVNTTDGLKSADPDLINMLRTLGANRWQVFAKGKVPTSLPFMFSGIKIGISVAVIGAVVGEWVGSNSGLGYLAIRSQSQFLSDRVYAASAILCAMGISLFLLAGLLERLLLPWYYNERRQRALGE